MKLDFFTVGYTPNEKYQILSVYPEFLVKKNKDLLVRGGKFYAVIDKETGFWQTDERLIQEYVDEELNKVAEETIAKRYPKYRPDIKSMMKYRSKSWPEYKGYISSLPDSFHQLDDRLCFADQKVVREDYISKQLPYALKRGPYDSWNKLVGTLYSPDERRKIEWAIGSIVSGESIDIQKFVVFYGKPGAGKGTILSIIQKLFQGYYEVFDAKSLSNNSNAFAFEQFRTNPLVAIQMDGDLSKIEDNTKINSLVSHETIVMNEKRKQSYNFTPHCFLFMASNKPVQITDAKSGLLRRLIDVNPSGNVIPRKEYDQLMGQIDFELSGIAYHCLEVYQKLGKNYYNSYNPLEMMERTNIFFNFMGEYYDQFMEADKENHGIQAADAYDWWKDYCMVSGLEYKYMPMPKFKDELKEYFDNFDQRPYVDGKQKRNWYSGFKVSAFTKGTKGEKIIIHDEPTFGLVLDQKKSLLDDMLADCQAQYAEEKPEGGTKPVVTWTACKTTLKDIDTRKVHFVRVPLNHIVIDFDLKNDKGEKDVLLNMEAADKWPKTYAEYSQGGKGIHLHYIYEGDPMELESLYAKDIEIKVFSGKQSLRRRLSLCNNIPVATINCGLPKKEKKKDGMLDFESVKDEKHIRSIVAKCLKKDIAQPYTAPAVSLIKKTLDDAYDAGIKYDIRDMRPAILAFASKSHHQKEACIKMANDIKYFSKHFDEDHKWDGSSADDVIKGIRLNVTPTYDDAPDIPKGTIPEAKPKVTKKPQVDETLIFFDCEVFPNLLLVNWKEAGEGKGVVRMINPSRSEIGELFKKKLVGFNCRRYDNHILYARYLGYDNDAIYRLSQRIVAGSPNAMFGNAYDVSYTDVYDFAAKKQSLKKWEIELGIHHQELGLPWDQPVPEKRWAEVAEYCDNDVIATEAVFNNLVGDFRAREILAEIAGMTVNDTTNQLTTKIIFGDDPKPQIQFVYPDLTKKFPGYRFENGKSYYRHVVKAKGKNTIDIDAYRKQYGERVVSFDPELKWIEVDEEIGEGGRVYAVQGVFHNVTTFDVASMHPSSIIAENGFGKYTDGFKQLLDIRIAIKHKDFDRAKTMLNGRLAKYLDDPGQAKALSQALKIAINSVYGLTAAGFENKFRDPRNKDNWVAKRGALFIETLRLKVMEMGGKVVHIKTDSIKVENPTKEISDFIIEYGKKWGYNFEIEDVYEKMCLVNDAVYIALRDRTDPSWMDECDKAKKKAAESGKRYSEPTRWTATGAQFQHPYVFKKLFSHEDIKFEDLCETKTVTSALYLDFNENLSDPSAYEKELDKINKIFIKTYGKDWETKLEGVPLSNEIRDLLNKRKDLIDLISKCHNYVFIGKAGSFCPIKPGHNGGILTREKDGKYYSATGAKGFRWRESESLVETDRMELIDINYFDALANEAKKSIEQYIDFEEFVKEAAPQVFVMSEKELLDKAKQTKQDYMYKDRAYWLPWTPPCGNPHISNCYDCPLFDIEKIPPECKKGYDLSVHFVLNEEALNKNK